MLYYLHRSVKCKW